jgi:tetrahydromethanopterin S-methyltransferase subunit C
MRAAEVAYITLRIQTSVTQELVGLLTVAAVYWSVNKARFWQENRNT